MLTTAQRLREALLAAMKARDRVAVAALRSALAAIGNAGAVEVDAATGRGTAIELSPVGVGVAEADRREVTEARAVEIVRAEVAAREASARAYEDAGRADRAELLRAEARVLAAYLTDGSSTPDG